ncbi:hypothetical protein [Streptomyces sp. DH41]|uniref:hypothetical protein n=1 Tax=Streptomyces sp. DH41 TaxID=3040125 RepID=UPI0024416476|nr:hypothetical protein [Streptomyces sp. DH41]MDG9725756.1 hypothetical protein [Streptomyces sp. DH41]
MRSPYFATVPSLMIRHELRLLASLWLWAARRTDGAAAGGTVFGYTRGQGAMMAGLGFVCVIETVMMSVLLRDWPTAHLVMLVLDVYAIVFVVGLHAASVVRPHVLDPDAGTLRVRQAVHFDVRIPLERIASVRRELRTTHERTDGELDLAVGAQTSVTVELAEPVAYVTFFGRRREVRVVRLHADDAGGLVQAVERARDGYAVP